MLTQEQLDYINEAMFDTGFEDPSPFPEILGSQVSADGIKSPGEPADPQITDRVAQGAAPNRYFFGFRNGNGYSTLVREGFDNNDKSGDGVNDMFNTNANQLNNGNPNDDREIISHSVQRPLNALINATETAGLTPYKKANVINKVIDKMDLTDLPQSYKRETAYKILNKN